MGTWSFRARKGGNYTRTYVRARTPPLAAAAGRPVPEPGRAGLGLGLGLGFLYLTWFFLNQVSWSSPPAERFESPANGCPREQIRPFANRCRKTDSAVGRLIGCDGSVRTVETAGILADENTPPERYKKRPRGSFSDTPKNPRSLSLSLSL